MTILYPSKKVHRLAWEEGIHDQFSNLILTFW